MTTKFFKKEEVLNARNTNILDYLIGKGEPFIKQGKYFRHGEHSSWVYDSRKNVLYFNKDSDELATNSCINAAMKVYGFSFLEAVGNILGSEAQILTEKDFHYEPPPRLDYQKDIQESLTFKNAYDYLTNEREIDSDIVDSFHKLNLIAEDTRQNVIFKTINRDTCQPIDVVGVELRGTRKIPEEKRLFKDRSYYLFQHPGNDPTQLFFTTLTRKVPTKEIKVFEAPIEIMSYLSIHKQEYLQEGSPAYNTEFCSMSGLKHTPVEQYFRKVVEDNRSSFDHPVIPEITLCVNRDEAGMEFIDRFKKYLHGKGYSDHFIEQKIQIELPVSDVDRTKEFDFNDQLKERNWLKTQIKQNARIL